MKSFRTFLLLCVFALLSASCGKQPEVYTGDDLEDEPEWWSDTDNKAKKKVSKKKKAPKPVDIPKVDKISIDNGQILINDIGPLYEVFNDSNKYQYEFAEKLGIDPIESFRDAYHTKKPIRHIVSNKYFIVDSLTHSMPFLVPPAARLLEDIGKNFIDTLSNRGAKGYRIIVTSMLRTASSVKRLRRVNVNATDSSTHKFATTFDISYTRYHSVAPSRQLNDGDLKNVLAEVLYDLRRQNRCLVKFERKTGCFHVTVIK